MACGLLSAAWSSQSRPAAARQSLTAGGPSLTFVEPVDWSTMSLACTMPSSTCAARHFQLASAPGCAATRRELPTSSQPFHFRRVVIGRRVATICRSNSMAGVGDHGRPGPSRALSGLRNHSSCHTLAGNQLFRYSSSVLMAHGRPLSSLESFWPGQRRDWSSANQGSQRVLPINPLHRLLAHASDLHCILQQRTLPDRGAVSGRTRCALDQ